MKLIKILAFSCVLHICYTTGSKAQVNNFNIGLLTDVQRIRGVQMGLFTSMVGESMKGTNIAGVLAYNNGRASGLQLSGVINISKGFFRGVQLSGIANVSTKFVGVQIANYNHADTLIGTQIGLINSATSHPRGWQIGIINYTQDTIAHKIGLVNVNPNTKVDVLIYGGNSTLTNAALRFRNRSTYNMIGFGLYYLDRNDKFSGALFYRIGQYFYLTRKLSVSGDIGYYHIERAKENSIDKPQRLYSLQGRINLDYQFLNNLGAFVTTGYGESRQYGSRELYRRRLIIESGISIRYNNK